MTMNMIQAQNVHYDYIQYEEEGAEPAVTHAVKGVDMDIEKGQFIAILGHNGSGKSTLAKHFNALLIPTEGTVYVRGTDTREEEKLWEIRQSAGMVFQNPDNQIIASVVEEDVGFGPENLGVPTEEIWKRVDEALAVTGMTAYREFSPNKLSGGQKQRVAIAGVMAMKPECIILDEPTAMLDPTGRKEVLEALRVLNKEQGVTVLLITHNMEETITADRIFVMDKGRIALSGTPAEVFAQVELLTKIGLDVPQVTRLAYELQKEGVPIEGTVLSIEDFVEKVSLLACDKGDSRLCDKGDSRVVTCCVEDKVSDPSGPLLRLEHVSYRYGVGTAYEVTALDDVSLEIGKGEFIGLIGHTGSGKSTLIQHLNGLIRPGEGVVTYNGKDIWGEGYHRRDLRFHVGIVFQYPEHQLFETDVISDVCFGPKNQGLSGEEAMERAKKALASVGIDEESYERSPFELSGGQKRRVAIAGVLAMEPDVLILDEPAAGLDPAGRREILNLIDSLHKERGMSIILVSHSMEDVADYADRLIVIDHGKKAFDGTPKEIFSHYKELEKMDLAAPQVTYVCHALAARGVPVDVTATTVAEAKRNILKVLGRNDA